MPYILHVTEFACRELRRLPRAVAQRIVEKLDFFISQPDPLQYATRLRDSRFGRYRFRIGDHRAIFDLSHRGVITILVILTVKHRKDVYRDI